MGDLTPHLREQTKQTRWTRQTQKVNKFNNVPNLKQRGLGWEPKVKFKDLVRMMVDADVKDLEEMRRCQDVIRKLSNNKNVGG